MARWLLDELDARREAHRDPIAKEDDMSTTNRILCLAAGSAMISIIACSSSGDNVGHNNKHDEVVSECTPGDPQPEGEACQEQELCSGGEPDDDSGIVEPVPMEDASDPAPIATVSSTTPQDWAICRIFGKKKKCPDDVPADDKWLYDMCMNVGLVKPFKQACNLFPPPVDKICDKMTKIGQKGCCDGVLNTKVEPWWQCSMQTANAQRPTYNACKACCDAKYPIMGTTNAVNNNQCTNSCTKMQGALGWPDS